MNWTSLTAGVSNAANQRLWGAVGDRADVVAQKLIGDKDYTARVARLMLNEGYEPTTSQVEAHEIMGDNFFGVEDAMKRFQVIPTPRDLAVLSYVPWSKETLLKCKDTHVLVAVFPLSVLQIAETYEEGVCFYESGIFGGVFRIDRHGFASKQGSEPRWYLIKKTPQCASYAGQGDWRHVSEDEEVLEARVAMYTIIGFRKTSVSPLLNNHIHTVRCAERDMFERPIFFGMWDKAIVGRTPYFTPFFYASWRGGPWYGNGGMATGMKRES